MFGRSRAEVGGLRNYDHREVFKMKLAENFSIESAEYASQGNAILGIRDSGKTYTATAIAEKLLDAGVPLTSSTFRAYIWKLNSLGLIERDGEQIKLINPS